MATDPQPFDGGGPGSHPGVSIIQLQGDTSADANSIEALLEAKRDFLFTYQVGGSTFAVFASKY